MNNVFQKYKNYFKPSSLKLINICFIVSSTICQFSLLLLFIYNKYYITINLYKSSLILFRTGLMIGLFPIPFTIIIEDFKQKH